MTSKRKRARRLAIWRAYQRRADRLVADQPKTAGLLHPMRVCPGFFRAEGWDTRGLHKDLRHGA